MKVFVVTTTIYVPTFLEAYARNAKRYQQEVSFIVIGDRKTPEAAEVLCSKIDNCLYVSLEAQHDYLKKFSALDAHIPENSIARRNIGHLLAYEAGADCVIMLDDDNLATSQDFVRHHSVVGEHTFRMTYGSSNGWFNVASMLVEKNGVSFYPRGYPPSKRWKDGLLTVDHETFSAPTNGSYRRVAVNAGLWLNDPDIDALTRLERHLIVTGVNRSFPDSVALFPGTWSPWNCQNTAISRDALQSYFLSPYTGRHLDIWASYITTKIAESQGDVITFGLPLSYHDRSPHNLYKDMEAETPWIILTDEFCDTLRTIPVPSTGYLDGLQAVIEGLDESWNPPAPIKEQYLDGLRLWHGVMKELQ